MLLQVTRRWVNCSELGFSKQTLQGSGGFTRTEEAEAMKSRGVQAPTFR